MAITAGLVILNEFGIVHVVAAEACVKEIAVAGLAVSDPLCSQTAHADGPSTSVEPERTSKLDPSIVAPPSKFTTEPLFKVVVRERISRIEVDLFWPLLVILRLLKSAEVVSPFVMNKVLIAETDISGSSN